MIYDEKTIQIQENGYLVIDSMFKMPKKDFNSMIREYKTDLDFFLSINYEGDFFDIKIKEIDDYLYLEAYNEKNKKVWTSQKILNENCKNCNLIIFVMMVMCFLGLIIYTNYIN